MIYNSNGNNTPYQSGGNAKVQKELKALEEAINNVTANFNDYVDDNNADITRIENNISAIDTTVSGLGTRLSQAEDTIAQLPTQVTTQKVVAEDADFHTVKAGKYTFQNGTQITGSNICKLAEGSVVYATDGTNSILVDYTANDAWVAKAKATNDGKFKIYQDGTLAFTESRGWTVYVLGNTFTLDGEASGTPVEIETGITIGGTLYAALARDYAFDNLTATNATFGIAGIDHVTISESTVQTQQTGTETVGTLTADAATINNLKAAKRDIQDIVNGAVQISAHPTNVACYIGIPKFTGTYQIKLDGQDINANPITHLTATIIWNGKDPIVQYNEYSDASERDYLYKIVLTSDALYFITQGAGTLYYSYDAFGGAQAPVSALFPNIPYSENDIRAEYVAHFTNRTVFFGDHSESSGVDILGELKADIIHLPEGISADNMILDGYLEVGGEATFHDKVNIEGNTKAKKVEAEELYGTMLGINDTGTKTDYEHNYLSANASGVNIGVNTTLDGNLTQTGNQNITGDETITGDVTHNGDLTQTGNQNVNGEVVISEKETINNIEPDTPGYYVEHDAWEINGVFIDNNNNIIAKPNGIEISRTPLEENVAYRLYNKSGRIGLFQRDETNFNLIEGFLIDGEGSIYDGYISSGEFEKYSPGFRREVFKEDFGSSGSTYAKVPDIYSFVEKRVNAVQPQYYRLGEYNTTQQSQETINGQYYYILKRSEITNADTINSCEPYFDGTVHRCLFKEYKKYRSLYTDSDEMVRQGNLSSLDYTFDNLLQSTLYVVKYREFIGEPDPDATYDDNNEVLTVKGNEKVTRDLKLQGNIFGDDYHTAFLPNIKSDSIELGDGVVRKIDKNAESGVVSYDATNAKFVTGDDLTLPGDLVVDGQITARKDLSISGDLYVNGTEHINDVETIQSSDDYFVLRHNKSTALGANEHAGIAVHNYALDKTATLTTDNQGIWRVADNSETSTTYTGVSYFNGNYYTGLTQTATTVIDGIKTAYDQDELDECAFYNSSYYHFDGINWYSVSLVDNVLTVGAKVDDAAVITALEALTRNDLVYYRSLTVTVISEVQNQPLLTRAEEADLDNGDILAWDGTNKKAVHLPRPALSNQALKSKITNGVVSYEWGNSGSAGVAFVGTRAEYDVARLIPEGQDGFIPPNSIVKITDEDDYVTGENR